MPIVVNITTSQFQIHAGSPRRQMGHHFFQHDPSHILFKLHHWRVGGNQVAFFIYGWMLGMHLHDCDSDSAEKRFARWVGVECSVGTAVAAAALGGTFAWAAVAVVADVNNGGAKELCEEGLVIGGTAAVGVAGTALKNEDIIKIVKLFTRIFS